MIDKLRQHYFQTVLVATTDEELYAILPNKNYSNFSGLMKGFINSLADEIKKNMSMLSRETDEEMIFLYKEEIKSLRRKLDICEEVLRSSYVIEESNEDTFDETQESTLIFGVSPAGNVSFFTDLKRDVDSSYYDYVLKLLEEMKSGRVFFNQEKVRKFTNNETKSGLIEIKKHEIRIMYSQLPNNMIYVHMVRVKKANMTKRDADEPSKRCALLSKDYERVKRIVKSGQGIEELILINEEVMQSIEEFINSKSKKEGKMNNA